MKTILVPIDFSEITKPVVTEAVRISHGERSRIILMHAVNPPLIGINPGSMKIDFSALLEAMLKAGAVQLTRWRTALRKKGVNVQTLQVEGIPVVEILRHAKKLRADRIVIGSHGHSGFYDLLIGSTTSGVLKRSRCPVVVVPAKSKGYQR